MASLIHFNFADPDWILPDRNTIPHNVPFFQNLRELLEETCHKHGILAIGGMTALYPSRADAELNERALRVLAEDKKNEANCLMDGAWTGHPDQNEIAVEQFPFPNQSGARKHNTEAQPDLRPPVAVGKITTNGTRTAIRLPRCQTPGLRRRWVLRHHRPDRLRRLLLHHSIDGLNRTSTVRYTDNTYGADIRLILFSY